MSIYIYDIFQLTSISIALSCSLRVVRDWGTTSRKPSSSSSSCIVPLVRPLWMVDT
ncbi:hypothetical protein BDQ12DRAFT_672590 [Crucibulum laeve]|uniref:Uncharacterized protein n=1 Tax=Crucibulum laeve TaxID=68775 RepID=A0A5C3MHS7_9AGAR|nr:hypothetical protein BDQ12DRAFT_672590 [Crucibulum laeve]